MAVGAATRVSNSLPQYLLHVGDSSRTRRHGSDERSASRRRRSRGRSAESFAEHANIRSGPAGPQERVEWMEALTDVQTRIHTLERINRDHASGIAALSQVTAEHTSKIGIVDKDQI